MTGKDRAQWASRTLRIAIPAVVILGFLALALMGNGAGPVGLATRDTVTWRVPWLGADSAVLVACGALFWFAMRLDGFATPLGVAIVFAVFALPLMGLWRTGYSDSRILGGLLPFSDARGYYEGAMRLIEGLRLGQWHSRRPLWPGALATMLWLTGGQLQIALAAFTGLTAAACVLAATAVRRTHGAGVAAIVLLVLFLFARSFVGLAMSECLGLALGSVAFALLWEGVRLEWHGFIYGGICLLTLALLARAGAFFVLGTLLCWGTLHYRRASMLSLRFLVGGVVAIGLAVLLHGSLLKLIGPKEGVVPFANFAHTIYGQAVGGLGWKRAYTDHPEINGLSDGEAAKRIYRWAWEAFRADPSKLVHGIFKAWRDYFNPVAWGAFSFVSVWVTSVDVVVVRCIFYALAACGLLAAVRRGRSAHHSMLLAATLGCLASVPFVPPFDADQMRAYAATIPLLAALVGLGFAAVSGKVGAVFTRRTMERSENAPPREGAARRTWFSAACVAFAAGLAAISSLGPLAVKAIARPKSPMPARCAGGLREIYVALPAGAMVQLIDDRACAGTQLPVICQGDFRRQMHISDMYLDMRQALLQLEPGETILLAPNLQDGLLYYVLVESRLVSSLEGIARMCITPVDSEWRYPKRFSRAESVELASTAASNSK